MEEKSIFSSLFKWAKSSDSGRKPKTPKENYCTQSLTIVLNQLLKEKNSKAVDIINKIFAEPMPFKFDKQDMPHIKVEPQQQIGNGNQQKGKRPTPDITIETSDKLIYVEVKVHSKLDRKAKERLKQYRKHLDEDKRGNKGLVLLTRDGNEYDGKIELEEISWFGVSEVLDDIKKKLKQGEDGKTESAGAYLLGQFYEFLQEEGMTLYKVDSLSDTESAISIASLLEICKVTLKELEGELVEKTKTKKSKRKQKMVVSYDIWQDDDYVYLGCRCLSDKYGLGIYYYRNEQSDDDLCFEIHDKNLAEVTKINNLGEDWWYDQREDILGHRFSAKEFIALKTGIVQKNKLKNFVKDTLKKWRQIQNRKGRR